VIRQFAWDWSVLVHRTVNIPTYLSVNIFPRKSMPANYISVNKINGFLSLISLASGGNPWLQLLIGCHLLSVVMIKHSLYQFDKTDLQQVLGVTVLFFPFFDNYSSFFVYRNCGSASHF
jgi:hypothetical protein